MDDKYLRRHRDELSASSAAVTPICIVVDTSASMNRKDRHGVKRIERLNEGVREFIEEIKKDDILADSVEIAAVTFNINTTNVNFATVDNIGELNFVASGHSGDTPKGVEAALQLLEEEKNFLKNNKKKYNQPWIVIMSDGRATPDKDAYIPGTKRKDFTEIDRRLSIVQEKTKTMEANKKLTVIPVLISEITDGEYGKAKEQMQGFTNSNRCKEIGDGASQVSFKEFFKIFSKSVSVNNADLMFDDKSSSTNVNSEKADDTYQDDYIAREDVLKMLDNMSEELDADIASNEIIDNDFEENETNNEAVNQEINQEINQDINEVTRLKNEATDSSSAKEALDEDVDINTGVEQKNEVEELSGDTSLTNMGYMPKPVLTVTKFTVTDDSYLEKLLADLNDDWDNI